jgi:hypothetical protein
MRQWIIFGLAGAASPASAVLTVFSGTSALEVVIETCVLKYFGPQSNVVEAPAVFLEGNALCHPKADAVRGKVVIGSMQGASSCNYMGAYRHLDAAGAVGFVKLVQRSPPGWSTVFDHDAWGTSVIRGMAMTMVEVFDGDLGIGPEEAAKIADFRLSILPPHNTEWEESDASVAWLVCMRIIMPLFGLVFVAWPGLNEAWSLWLALGRDDDLALAQLRVASFAVCLIAALCSFGICLLYALGQYSMTLAPNFIHDLFYTSFAGTSALTTSIACAALVEKYRGTPPRNFPLRVLTKQYPLALVLVTLFGPGVDFSVGYLRVSGLDEAAGFRRFHVVGGVVVSLIQGGFGLLFLYFSHALGKPLFDYMRLRSSSGNQFHAAVQQLSAVVIALVMNGAFLILNVVLTVVYVMIVLSNDVPIAANKVFLGLLPFLRLGLFYWQVCLVLCCALLFFSK